MKHLIKKAIFVAIFAIYGISASPETIVTIGSFQYSLNGLHATVYKYVGGYANIVTIPETIYYNGTTFTVTEIGSISFKDSNIEELFVPETVKKIADPSGGNGAFYLSKIKTIHLPGITYVGSYAFNTCKNLKVVDFNYSYIRTISIGKYAFDGCNSMTYIVLPKHSVISSSSFNNCDQLQYIIDLGSEGGYWTSINFNNVSVYTPKYFVIWNKNTFDYNGEKPSSITWTNCLPAGFAPTNNPEMSELESDAGSHIAYVPFTFANSDISFSADVPYNYTINKIELNARVKDSSKIYGDENPQFETEYSGFVNGEDESVILSNGLYTTEATIGSDVGTYTVSQSDAEAKNYSFNYEDGEITVNKAQLTMTANDKSMVYGGAIPTLDASYTGLKNNESKPVWTSNPNITTTATSSSQVGAYPITISDGIAKNYDVSFVDGILSIEKAELTIRTENKERLYGDANPEFTLSYSGLKNEESVPEWVSLPEIETIANMQSSVGSYPITIRNAIATNYNVTIEEGVLTINKAPLTLHPINVTRKYGEPNPQFELEFEGLKNNESSPEWTVSPVITTSATETSDVGNYNIEITSADAKNYILNKGVGILTVTKAPLEVAVKDCTKKYGENNPTFTLQYSGLLNDETEPVWTELPTFTTEATKTSGVGVYAVNASGGIMKNYETSAIAPGTLTITQSSLTIKPRNTSRIYFEENPSFSCTYEGFIGNDDESVFTTEPVFTTNATKESPVGVYLIEANGAEAENYEISYEKGELSIIKRQLTVSTNNYTRAYKEENPEFELIYNGFVNNENEENLLLKPVASTEATENSDTGVYDINISGGFAENYDFNYMGGKLTIEKAYQTLTWEQDLSEVEQYEQIELNATATSGLDISYTIEGAQICSINKIGNKTYLDCYGVGESVISAIQEGNNNYWQTTKAYKPLKIHTTNGISHIMMEIGENSEIYDIKGNRLQTTQRGLNIIKMEDGTIRKVVIK